VVIALSDKLSDEGIQQVSVASWHSVGQGMVEEQVQTPTLIRESSDSDSTH